MKYGQLIIFEFHHQLKMEFIYRDIYHPGTEVDIWLCGQPFSVLRGYFLYEHLPLNPNHFKVSNNVVRTCLIL